MLTTHFDLIFDIVKEKKKISVDKLASILNKHDKIKPEDLENYLKIFIRIGVVKVLYSTFGRGTVVFLNPCLDKSIVLKTDEREREKVLDSYVLTIENLNADVEIFNAKGDFEPTYMLSPPDIGGGSSWFLEYVSKQIPGLLKIVEDEERVGLKASDYMKKQLTERVRELIKDFMKNEDDEKKEMLSNILIHQLIGFGALDFLISDDYLEEIVIQGVKNPITVYHRKYAWMKTNIMVADMGYVNNVAEKIGRNIGRVITVTDPVLDAYMPSGERVSAILYPIAAQGNTITMRKFRKNPWTIIHLISPEYRTLNKEVAALLWICIQYELNILIAGGTASGKTSFLNSLCQFLSVTQHVITIEEIEELTLPKYFKWNWVPLVERKPIGGKGAVSLSDLLVTSLRMRPDRIIIGEVRRPKEAEVLFEAMHTGHSAYGTIHADNAYQVYRRMVGPPFEIPPLDLEALHLLVVQRRDRRTGLRRTYEVAEVQTPETFKEQEFSMSILYRWDSEKDEIVSLNKPRRIYDELYFHAGMSVKEINKDLKEKMEILDWMLKNEINYVDDVGKVVSVYYKDPGFVLDAVRNDETPDKILNY